MRNLRTFATASLLSELELDCGEAGLAMPTILPRLRSCGTTRFGGACIRLTRILLKFSHFVGRRCIPDQVGDDEKEAAALDDPLPPRAGAHRRRAGGGGRRRDRPYDGLRPAAQPSGL